MSEQKQNLTTTYDSAKLIIRKDLESMSRKFITIGYYLKYIRDNEMYTQDGFTDIWEFAQSTYGISKSTCSRWMAMNDKFSKGGNSPCLKEEFQNFGKSQLQEMLYLDDAQIQQAKPEMTAKEIREIRKPLSEYELYTSGYKEVFSDADKEIHMEYLMWMPIMCNEGKQWFEDRINELHGNNCKAVEEWAEKFLPVLGSSSAKMFDGKGIAVRYEHGKTFAVYPLYIFMYMFKRLYMQKPEQKKEIAEGPAKCITGESKSGFCGAAAYCTEPVKCCAQCKNKCNSQCGWIEVDTVQQDEQLPGQMSVEDYPEFLPDEKETCADDFVEVNKMIEQSVALAQQEEVAENVVETVDTLPKTQQNEVVCCENAAEVQNLEERDEITSVESDLELLREIHRKAKMFLKDMLECYTENDYRVRKQKLTVDALEDMLRIMEEPEQEKIVQPELPIMKNNDQRKEWLRNYKSWGLWYEDEHIGARFYKYEFDNGAVLIAEEYTTEGNEYCSEYESCHLHLVGGPEPPKQSYGAGKWSRHTKYNRFPNSETELVEFLKEVQKK